MSCADPGSVPIARGTFLFPCGLFVQVLIFGTNLHLYGKLRCARAVAKKGFPLSCSIIVTRASAETSVAVKNLSPPIVALCYVLIVPEALFQSQ